MTMDERDNFKNLILLCRNHHKIVDDNEDEYTVEKLNKMKIKHMEWVKKNKKIDKPKQRDDLEYASIVDRWSELANIDEWDEWTSFILSADHPRLKAKRDEALQKLIEYILSRIWPGRYEKLEDSFKNFQLVLNDFIRVFRKYSKSPSDKWVDTRKFYKEGGWNENYHEDLQKYKYHVDLVQDLLLELTRAGNRMCKMIRKYIDPKFRSEEGVLLVTSGPHFDFSFTISRVEYQNEDEKYPGLRRFMEVREERDKWFGEGVEESYFTQFP